MPQGNQGGSIITFAPLAAYFKDTRKNIIQAVQDDSQRYKEDRQAPSWLFREGKMLDEIDIKILSSIEADPNKPLINYLKPFSPQRTLSRLYARAANMKKYGLITTKKTSRVALVSITGSGKQAIKGRENSHPEGGASL